MRPCGRRDRLGTLGSLVFTMVSSGSSGFARFCPWDRLVHPGLLWCSLGVIRFIWGRWVHWGLPLVPLGSLREAVFIGVRREGVVGFIRGHRVL